MTFTFDSFLQGLFLYIFFTGLRICTCTVANNITILLSLVFHLININFTNYYLGTKNVENNYKFDSLFLLFSQLMIKYRRERKRETGREEEGEWETYAKRVRKRKKEEEIAFVNGVLRYTEADLLVVFTSKRTVSTLPRLAGLPSIQLYQHVNAVHEQYLSPVNCPFHDDENGSARLCD